MKDQSQTPENIESKVESIEMDSKELEVKFYQIRDIQHKREIFNYILLIPKGSKKSGSLPKKSNTLPRKSLLSGVLESWSRQTKQTKLEVRPVIGQILKFKL